MQFFRYFPTQDYAFVDPDGTSRVLTTTQLTAHIQLKERLQETITVFYDYIISDGQRPDSVAQAVYGSVNYTWVVLVVNNLFSLFDWPLTQDEFLNYITERYGSVADAQAIPVYRSTSGVLVDALTYGLLPFQTRAPATTAYDDELNANEVKRRIKVIPTAFLPSLVTNLTQVFQS